MASRRVLRNRNFGSYVAALNQDISLLSTRPNASSIAGNVVGSSALDSNISLDNNTLQSSNYVPGYYGWKIDSNGLAEFGNVYVRGDINARTGTIGYWHISTPTVERTIGNRQLFGTFLESSDIGYSDDGKVSGSYVSLFKSYDEPAVSITNKYRRSNIATITAPEHGFENADFVIINVDNDMEFSTGESSIQIFGVTRDTFSYLNTGDDFLNEDETGLELDTSASGTAQLYIKDVSGLYLQDYGKALFDYGYFSNEGVAYVSAETPNLVYNASFEYVDENSVTQASFDSHIGGYSAYLQYPFSTEDKYNGDSVFGMQLQWNDVELGTYYHLKVNSSEFERLDFYKNNRELHINFDMFYDMPINKVAVPTTNSFFVDGADITIVCPGHGLQIGDLVFLDFTASGSGYYYNGPKIREVLDVDGNSFVVYNEEVYTGPYNPITLSRLYTTSGPVIFKYTHAMLDLNDVKISFVTDISDIENPVLDSTTSLYDVATDVTIANWEDYRYWTPSTTEFEVWYRYTDYLSASPSKPYRPIASMGVQFFASEGTTRTPSNVKLSSSKIESYYRSIVGLSEITAGGGGNDFYLSIPEWLWESRVVNDSLPPTKIETKAKGGYTLDNVFISPSNKFFFGDSGSSSFYYKLTENDLVKTNKVSYEAPRQWLDIDLDYQTAEFKYIDSIEFKSSDFLKQLYINPGINTVKNGSTSVFGGSGETLLIGESSVVNITSGQYRYLDASSEYKTVEAFSTQETGTNSAAYVIKARSSGIGALGDGAGSSISLAVDSTDKGWAELKTDYFSMFAQERIQLFTFGATPASLEISSNFTKISTYNGVGTFAEAFLYMEPSFAHLNSSIRTVVGSGGAHALEVTPDEVFFQVNNIKYFGLNNLIQIEAQPILNNDLTSSYESVYISTLDNTLGYVSSSIATKKNVEPLQLSVDSILAAEPVQFNYKSEEDGSPKHAGFIAEQLVDAGLGNYVSFDADGSPRSINYEMFVSALQSVVRHQATQIADLNSRLSALEGS